MMRNGWEMDVDRWWDEKKSGVEDKIHVKRCGNSTFWGYKYGNSSGRILAPFKGFGEATLDFGSCGDTGITAVYHKRPAQNYERIGVAEGAKRELSKVVTFLYEPGDILKIEEEQTGIMKINSFKLACKGS